MCFPCLCTLSEVRLIVWLAVQCFGASGNTNRPLKQTVVQKIVICCSLLALDGMDTCCWTGTVADWDRESRRRKKLAVLCCSVVLKSPGATLGVWQKRVQQPIILTAVQAAAQVQDCHCCRHNQLCWSEPLAVNVLLTKLLPFAVLHDILKSP